jgi:histone H3/H4
METKMSKISISALKEILKSTGARSSDEGARELARAVEEIARKIAERSKTLAEHAGRKTIKAKDIKLALDDWKKQ